MSIVGGMTLWIRSSIQRRLIFITIVFWIVSTSMLSLVLIFAGRAIMTGEANQRNEQIASVVSRETNAEISTIIASARTFATYIEQLPPDLTSQARAFLALRLTSPQRYRAAFCFDAQGNLLLRLDDPPGELLALGASRIASRPPASTAPDILAAFKACSTGMYVSPIAFDPVDLSPLLLLSLPVKSPAGDRVLILKVDVSDIWERIDLMTLGQSGIAYLVSRDGTIIAHPDRAYVGKPAPGELKPFLAGSEGHTQYIEPSLKEAVLAAISPVGGTTGWATVIQQDKSEAYAAVSRALATSAGLWSLLAAFGALAILLSVRTFARPIVGLTRTARSIASTGQLARIATLQNPDEVGQLSQAFDGMIGKLQSAESELREAHQELESRVIVRTAELTETNRLLKTEITQREQVEQALRESEHKFRQLVQGTVVIILEIDLEGRVRFLNQSAKNFFDFTEPEIIGRSIVGTIVPPRESSGRDLAAMVADILACPERLRRNEHENMKKSGELAWIAWSYQPMNDEHGRPRSVLCVGMDMTEQVKAKAILDAQAREQAAAEERSRLARDLHDAVSQMLFSASLTAEALPKLWDMDPERGREGLREVRQLTRGALAEMRTLLFELRPSALANAELTDLLKQLAEAVTGRAGVPVSTQFEGRCCLPFDTKIAFYRIAQEALNNMAKHAHADRGEVILKCEPGRVELRVKDNGTGFDPSAMARKSLGLGIMRERARAVGTSLDVLSESGRGTQVTAVWQNSPGQERQ